MTTTTHVPPLERLRAETVDQVVQYLDSTDRDSHIPRTSTLAHLADTVAQAGAEDASAGPAAELVDAWETAHRVVQADRDAPCPCARHTPGSTITLENLVRLVDRLHPDPDLHAAIAAIDDEANTPRPEGSRESIHSPR